MIANNNFYTFVPFETFCYSRTDLLSLGLQIETHIPFFSCIQVEVLLTKATTRTKFIWARKLAYGVYTSTLALVVAHP